MSGSNFAYSYAERILLLQQGALYRYCQNVKSYRCPEADKNSHRTYVMPAPMNAEWMGAPGSAYGSFDPAGLVYTKLGQIQKSKERVVFFEEKQVSADAFQFAYATGNDIYWENDVPNIMHGNGANFGFADGHAEFFEWKCPSTLQLCQVVLSGGSPNLGSFHTQATKENCGGGNTYNGDAKWVENAIWGRSMF
jgi:prepilin-type processing-associated H-X9-DG protein